MDLVEGVTVPFWNFKMFSAKSVSFRITNLPIPNNSFDANIFRRSFWKSYSINILASAATELPLSVHNAHVYACTMHYITNSTWYLSTSTYYLLPRYVFNSHAAILTSHRRQVWLERSRCALISKGPPPLLPEGTYTNVHCEGIWRVNKLVITCTTICIHYTP